MNVKNTINEQSELKKEIDWKLYGFKFLIGINIAILIIIVIYFQFGVRGWINGLKPQINQINDSYQKLYNKYTQVDDIGKNSNQYYTLQKKDLESIKSLIFYIKNDNEKLYERMEQETANVVDRVNLYISIAVVLLTLIGIFTPIIVQNMGNHQIQEKYNELKNEFGSKNEKLDEFNHSINDIKIQIEEVDKKTIIIDELDEKLKEHQNAVIEINDNIKQLPPVRLMFYFHQALDINNFTYYSRSLSDTYKYFFRILNSIKIDIDKCRGTQVTCNDSILRDSCIAFVDDCNAAQLFGTSRLSTNMLKSLGAAFKDFINEDNSDDNKKYEILLTEIDKILFSLEEQTLAAVL